MRARVRTTFAERTVKTFITRGMRCDMLIQSRRHGLLRARETALRAGATGCAAHLGPQIGHRRAVVGAPVPLGLRGGEPSAWYATLFTYLSLAASPENDDHEYVIKRHGERDDIHLKA